MKESKQDKSEKGYPDFSKIEDNIDKLTEHLEEKIEKKDEELTAIDKIKLAHEIRANPPKPGFMKVEVPPAIYSIDLNTDAYWWFNRISTVFPLILNQGIRTYMDLKDSFKPEKRKIEFPYLFLILAIAGIAVAVILVMTFVKF
jgi:hypothetical protein